MAKFRTGKYGSPKVGITIRCIANDLPCDMEELNPDYTRTFASKGDCMRFLNIGSKQFSKFVKGEPCSISEVWKVVSVGGHDS